MSWFIFNEVDVLLLLVANYMFKVNNKNTTRTRYEICSKLTVKIPE